MEVPVFACFECYCPKTAGNRIGSRYRCFFIIDIRLGIVQFYLGDKLTGLAKDSWSRNIPFEAKRGEILDRNGVELATNISAPTVYVIPRQIENPGRRRNSLLQYWI